MTTRERYLGMIRKWDDPALHAECEPLRPGDDLSFLRDMRKACQFADGVGLGAPQIGVLKRAVFLWPGQAGYGRFLLNPAIVAASPEKVTGKEGCLSFPGFTADVERHAWVQVAYHDERFTHHLEVFRDFHAVIAQHEIDHTNGVCRVGDAWREREAAVAVGADVMDWEGTDARRSTEANGY